MGYQDYCIDKNQSVREAMKLLDAVELTAPVKVGDVVIENVLGTGANFIATRNM